MKEQIEIQDATPNKRIFRSIIADYDAQTSICELIDNAIDIWTLSGKSFKLEVTVVIDVPRQTIRIKDNAGGIKKDDLHNIVGPGHSKNDHGAEIIGIFGVGSKRAVIALSQQITIKSRNKAQPTFAVEIDDQWLEDDSWHFPVYRVGNIDAGSTEIEMTKLREYLGAQDVRNIYSHLSATYAKLLNKETFSLVLNEEDVKATVFDDKWSYNPDVPPKSLTSEVILDREPIEYTVTGGLITEGGDSGYGEYGVYIYCNSRLIARALKTFEVGFTKGKVGVPHGSISLARVIIEIRGPAHLMPWNSSKSGIDSKHKLFMLTRNGLIEVIKHYASASRALIPERETKIKPYTDGKIKAEKIESVAQINNSYLPPVPKTKKQAIDKAKEGNSSLAKSEPWIVGSYESVIAAEQILKKKYETKNRLALILLDSSVEIAFKDYLTHKVDHFYPDHELEKIFQARHKVEQEVKKKSGSKLSTSDWTQVAYYYRIRCDLIHKRVSADVLNSDVLKFLKLTKKVHRKLLGIRYPKE